MSHVDNLILTAFFLDDDDKRARAVEAWDLGRGQHFIHVNSALSDDHGGGVALESDVFVLAANYLDFDALRRHLLDFDYEGDRDSVQIAIRGEADSAFTMRTLDEFEAWCCEHIGPRPEDPR